LSDETLNYYKKGYEIAKNQELKNKKYYKESLGLMAINKILACEVGQEFIETIGKFLICENDNYKNYSEIYGFWISQKFFKLLEKVKGSELDKYADELRKNPNNMDKFNNS
jgi:uncharacterized protein YbjQ (UPF0145 family)